MLDLDGIELNGKFFWYTEGRIPADKIPEHYFRYSVRSSDDDEGLGTIERNVIVNHEMDIITTEELDFNGKDFIEINEWNYVCVNKVFK